MKELFVPYEIAKQLKEKGFDEPCLGWYYKFKKNSWTLAIGEIETEYLAGTAILAPLYQQVISWLYKKGIKCEYNPAFTKEYQDYLITQAITLLP